MRPSPPQPGAINLGQGFPDEDGPAEVLEAARAAIADGVNQYPPGRGIPDLRAAIAEHQQRFYGLAGPGRDVLVTAGATEAIAAALLALVEGRTTRSSSSSRTTTPMPPSSRSPARRLVTVPLRWPDFQPDLDGCGVPSTDRTRVILVNDPAQPHRRRLQRRGASRIVELAERTMPSS